MQRRIKQIYWTNIKYLTQWYRDLENSKEFKIQWGMHLFAKCEVEKNIKTEIVKEIDLQYLTEANFGHWQINKKPESMQ